MVIISGWWAWASSRSSSSCLNEVIKRMDDLRSKATAVLGVLGGGPEINA